jgi:tRNA nucleotidyltransferase (CCA-adding enzyme)
VHDLIARCDGFRKPARIARLGLACECDKRGRLGMEDEPYPQRATLDALHRAACAITTRDLDIDGLAGDQIGERVRQARIAAIEAAR